MPCVRLMKRGILEGGFVMVMSETRPPRICRSTPPAAAIASFGFGQRHAVLDTNVRRVLAHAETTNRKFLDRETGHFLASFTPHRVTYWVEYVMEEGVARVFTAYSHRMNVVGVGK